MFTSQKLAKAIITSDVGTIKALVARHGAALLSQPLPGNYRRGQPRPGDQWLKRVFKKPPALTLALYAADDETVTALVALGARPARELDHNFPNQLFVAAALGRVRILDGWLAAYPALAQWRNADNDNLLHVAAQHGQADVVALLLKTGQFPLAARSQTAGCTPLVYAEKIRDAAIVALLLDAELAQKTGEDVPAKALPASQGNASHWHILDDKRIARMTNSSETGDRLVEIFNFHSRDIWRIRRDADGISSAAETIPFGVLLDATVVEAAADRLGCSPHPKKRK